LWTGLENKEVVIGISGERSKLWALMMTVQLLLDLKKDYDGMKYIKRLFSNLSSYTVLIS
jgi:hypothetical protein